MRPLTIGRVLGTGLRVVGKMAGERIMGEVSAPTGQPVQPRQGAPATTHADPQVLTAVRNASQTARQVQGGITQGVGGFLRPFRRVGGIVWLEVTGAFFLLPVAAFAPNLWHMRASWAHGPDHKTFLVTAGVVVVFLYLGVSSFWRARRR